MNDARWRKYATNDEAQKCKKMAQEKLKTNVLVGTAGGMVAVTVTGHKEL